MIQNLFKGDYNPLRGVINPPYDDDDDDDGDDDDDHHDDDDDEESIHHRISWPVPIPQAACAAACAAACVSQAERVVSFQLRASLFGEFNIDSIHINININHNDKTNHDRIASSLYY